MDAIILAAGNSSRFGSNKLLHLVDGKPMYTFVLTKCSGLKQEKMLDNLIFVTQYEEIAQAVQAMDAGISLVMNHRPELGISHSIYLGMKTLQEKNPTSKACLFTVSDQPYLRKESLAGLVQTFSESSLGIAQCVSGTRGGNPVIFSRAYYPQLAQLTGDRGGRQLVKKYPQDVADFEIDPKELEDIDWNISSAER